MPPPTPFTPALLVVDLQRDFCPPSGTLPVPDARSTITPINTLLTLPFHLKLATKDWHPTNHISFASNHPSSPPPFTSSTTITHPSDPSRSYTSTLWPVHCVQYTPGAELVEGLDVEKLHDVVYKGTDPRVEMYSAFCDPFHWDGGEGGGVSDSGLAGRLKERGVTDVYIAGLAMDYCVKATAEDAVRFGFRVWVVREGTRAVGGVEGARKAEAEMKEAGVKCVDLDLEEVGWVRSLRVE
ncbi:Isochorismatase hydrolase [Wilcoxina mikolae CBS 423.85]|nr:Isochorismatase hydrolase [Wilcoxina mikolae CBS 423.85]